MYILLQYSHNIRNNNEKDTLNLPYEEQKPNFINYYNLQT